MNKKQKIQVVVVIGAGFWIIIAIFFSPLYYISQWYGELDPDLKHLFTTVIVASMGGTLFAFRNHANKEVLEEFEAMELLLLIVMPCVEGYSFIMKTPSNYQWAILVYIAGVMGWFVLVISRHKIFEDPKKEKKFTFSITYLMLMLASFGTFAIWLLATAPRLSSTG